MLAKVLNREKHQLPCWIPVLISIGILLRFQIDQINLFYLIFLILLSFFIGYISSNVITKLILNSICAILIGILALQIRIEKVNSPVIPFNNKFVNIIGKIENITPLEHGYRLILSDIKIKKLNKENTPYKIRLTLKKDINQVTIGNIVKLNAIINKPMQAYLPDSYNFARDAYFKQIGAVGYIVSDLEIIETDKKSFLNYLNILRNNIQNRVIKSIGNFNGSIATALMLNEYNNIDKEILKDLRATGLSHILSVSGMHLSLVVAIFFFSSRFLINCFEGLALRINCKKISAFIALIGSLAYLLISGMEVAAVRSFIMTSMIIIAILIDRTSSPMRAIAFAASIILIINPENIIHPSFQMSFSAVLALIACFDFFRKINFNLRELNLLQKIFFYFASLSFASLVAGFATAPFALYHFSQFANYSILANLIAVPITSFLLMPCVILTFLFYPLHLEYLSLYVMNFGIKLLIDIAHYISNLPHSITAFTKISDINLLIISFGMMWFCIWISRIRFLGIIVIISGIISQSLTHKPDIFIDWDNGSIAAITSNNRIIYLSKPLSNFKNKLLMNRVGAESYLIYKENIAKEIYCTKDICTFNKYNIQAKIHLKSSKIEIYKNGKISDIIQNGKNTSFIYLK